MRELTLSNRLALTGALVFVTGIAGGLPLALLHESSPNLTFFLALMLLAVEVVGLRLIWGPRFWRFVSAVMTWWIVLMRRLVRSVTLRRPRR